MLWRFVGDATAGTGNQKDASGRQACVREKTNYSHSPHRWVTHPRDSTNLGWKLLRDPLLIESEDGWIHGCRTREYGGTPARDMSIRGHPSIRGSPGTKSAPWSPLPAPAGTEGRGTTVIHPRKPCSEDSMNAIGWCPRNSHSPVTSSINLFLFLFHFQVSKTLMNCLGIPSTCTWQLRNMWNINEFISLLNLYMCRTRGNLHKT